MAWLLIPAIIMGTIALTSTEGFASDLSVTETGDGDSSCIETENGEYAVGVTPENGEYTVGVTSENGVYAASVMPENGEYTVIVTLEGGTGRASVTSPCILIVEDEGAYARIEWSSPNYDYMIMEDVTYLPVNEDGNSVFEIPVTVFDEPMTVIADTTAMSVPHEIEYTLTFDSESITGQNATTQAAGHVVCMTLILIAAGAVILLIFNRQRKHQK